MNFITEDNFWSKALKTFQQSTASPGLDITAFVNWGLPSKLRYKAFFSVNAVIGNIISA